MTFLRRKKKYMNLNEKMINSTMDKDIIRFYRLFEFLNKQKMPKVGDHVFRKHSDGRKINNALYIVDGVIEPGNMTSWQ